ncbi:MAG: hypothetical protein WC538_24000 [Thermoanaerobaculia bacterium]|jgi:hypothetical protein
MLSNKDHSSPAGFAFRASRFALSSLALFLLNSSAFAAPATTLPPVVERALETMERSDQEGYAYRMSKTEAASTEVAIFDPAKPEGQTWRLLQKDGKTPTAKEMEEFRKERAEREKKRVEQKKESKSKGKGDKELREMIAPESVQLISETAERATYRFKMRADDEDAKKFADAVRGTLVIAKAAPHVESLDLASTGEIKPMTGVKIAEFHLALTFLPPDAYGQALPASVHSVVRGRAMLVKKLDQDATITFSDYARRASPVTPAR